MIKPAIVAVGYNRPQSMKRLLDSITSAYYPFGDIDLVVSIDESSMSDEVQKVAEAIVWTHGEKIIKRYPERQGLRRHIIQCGDLSEKYGAVIILEDDLVVSPSFYLYAYEAINRYDGDKKVSGVALYSHMWNGYAGLEFRPVKNEFDSYFGQYSITWGQCWTFEQWSRFKEWYNTKIDRLPEVNCAMPRAILRWSEQSWGKYFISYMVEQDLYYVVPYVAMSTNFSEVGQHNVMTDASHQVSLQQGRKENYLFPSFKDGIKYDVFFERIFEKTIAGIPPEEICINLNGMRLDLLGKRYLLTTKRDEKFNLIASFGMRMRPVDANVDYVLQGEDIFLYDVGNINIVLKEYDVSKNRQYYETYGLTWRILLKVGVQKFNAALKSKLKKRNRKR